MMDDMHLHHPPSIRPLPRSGFSLLEALTALAIFSGAYMVLISAHAHIASQTQKQVKALHNLIALSNQHEIKIAVHLAQADK